MQVRSRLIVAALAVAAALLGRRGTGGSRSTFGVAIWISGIRHAGHGLHHLVSRFPAVDHHRDHAFRSGAAADRASCSFNAKSNPVPSQDDPQHACSNWPGRSCRCVILVVIAIPSFRLLVDQLNIPAGRSHREGDRQAVVLELQLSRQRQVRIRLADGGATRISSQTSRACSRVDNEMVVPVNKIVRVQVIGADVIHAFAVPSFGIKIDAIPGRLNETWFRATREGVYLRPVLGTVRQGPRLHADRGARRQRAGIHGLGRRRKKKFADTGTAAYRRSLPPASRQSDIEQ